MKAHLFRHFCLLLTVFLPLSGQSLQLSFGPGGLSSLRFADAEFLSRGSIMVNSVEFAPAHGQNFAGHTQCTRAENLASNRENLAFDWGIINVTYQRQGNKLLIAIDISNQSPATLKAMSLDALALQLPSTPREYDGKTPLLATNIGAPSLLTLTSKGSFILVANEEVRKPLLLGVPWSLNAPAKTVFPVRINTGRDSMYPDSLPFIDRPIPPGGKDSMLISLRFSTLEAGETSAKEILAKFAGLHEFVMHWPDRRPIGSLILATAATHWPGNPRGWLLDKTIDVHTPGGIADFHRRVLAWADHSIDILKKMNAQGMITWDIEGEEFAHPTTYIGNPAFSEALAPEMAGILDDYFSRFKKAGLRVGLTIRPQKLEQQSGSLRQTESPDPATELIRKIAYAKKRWGATLFYIDSNGDAVLPLSFDIVAKVARTFPDVLLIPEHKNVAYYSRSAPYSESRTGTYATPRLVAGVYPNSFSIINTADGQIEKHRAELLSAVNRGDILMFRGWFDDAANDIVRSIYAQSSLRGH